MKEEAKREAQLLSDLHNSYIVKYYKSFLENHYLNIVMEYCENGDLSNLIKKQRGKYMPENTIWKYFIEVCTALLYLHKRRILHRDIKTPNIFVAKDGHLRLGDLGVAKVLSDNTNFAHTIVGTPYYLSPELCQEKPYNFKSDIWALGVVLYEMCALKYPYEAKNQYDLAMKIMQGKYEKLPTYFTSNLADLLNNCMIKDYKNRPSIFQLLSYPTVQQKAKELGLEVPSPEILLQSVYAKENNEKNKKPVYKAEGNKEIKKAIAKHKHSSNYKKINKDPQIPKEPIIQKEQIMVKQAMPKENIKEQIKEYIPQAYQTPAANISEQIIKQNQNKEKHSHIKELQINPPQKIEDIEAKVHEKLKPYIEKSKAIEVDIEEKPIKRNEAPIKIKEPPLQKMISNRKQYHSNKKVNKHQFKSFNNDPFNEFQFHSDLDHPTKLPEIIYYQKQPQSEKKYNINDIRTKPEAKPQTTQNSNTHANQEHKEESRNKELHTVEPIPITNIIPKECQKTIIVPYNIETSAQEAKEELFEVNEIPAQHINPKEKLNKTDNNIEPSIDATKGRDSEDDEEEEGKGEDEKVTESAIDRNALLKEIQKDLEDLIQVAESLKMNCTQILGKDKFDTIYTKVKCAWNVSIL